MLIQESGSAVKYCGVALSWVSSRARDFPSERGATADGLLHIRFMLMKQGCVKCANQTK
jgi:hypothetical protein